MGKNKLQVKKHVMTGISYMIPIIVAGGILGALAKGFGGYDIGNFYSTAEWATPFTGLNAFSWLGFWWAVNMLSSYAMGFGVAVMTAGVAYSIAGRPGIVPGLIVGYACSMSKAGFLGGLLMGFVIGYFLLWVKTWKVPKWFAGLMPVMVMPILGTLVCGMLFLAVFSNPLAFIMDEFKVWIMSLGSGSKFVIGAVIGACMGFDLGGPVNKTASMAANALGADGVYGPMSAKIVGGMTPPCGLFVASLVAPKKFTSVEKDTAITALPMGLCFITEGVLPFAAADPIRFIPCSMLGSAVAGGIAVAMGVESVAGHGGIFVVPMMVNPVWFIIALLAGTAVTGVVYALLRKPSEENSLEEKIVDLDIDISM
jgi:PTS system fructose-specific IIC component